MNFRNRLAVAVLLPGLASPLWAQQVVEVSIVDAKFVPEKLKVRPGTTVKWVNNEKRSNHSVWFQGELPESERFFPGESWSRTFDKPGLYRYTCGPHPEMVGEVEVVP